MKKVKNPPRSATEIISRIKTGKTDPRLLNTDSRQRCVEYLLLEGVTIAEIAQILKCSERTIGRDRRDARRQNALERDPELAGILAGQLLAEADNCIARIRRAIRANDTSAADKVAGERACFEITDKVVARLQSLGYLPQASTKIEAELRVGPAMSLDEISKEAKRLEGIQASGPKRRKKVASKSRPTLASSSSAEKGVGDGC